MSTDHSRDERKPAILIVDDEPVQRTLVSQAVEHAGMTAIEAENGVEGIRKTRELRPDLIILDVIMPKTNGFAVCQTLRADPETAHLPILMVTGLDDTESIKEAFEVGATAFLTKPLHAGLLGYHLRYMLRAARMERESREAMRLAQEASIAKSQFLANMSHELRTPLNAILGFSEIMAEEHLGPMGSPRYRSYAEDINKSATGLLHVINEILDISQIETGKFELRTGPVDPREMFDAVFERLGPRASKASVALSAEVEPGLTNLRSDQVGLKKVLLNLVGNAIKFTPAGGSVSVRATTEPSGDVLIVVADNGIGIAPNQIDTALSVFGQVDGRLSRKYEGTGLGLPLAKMITERLGGTLSLDSAIGAGTTVTLRFPNAAIDAAPRPDAPRLAGNA